MTALLESYCADMEFPDVSGAEHLQLLRTRDKLAAAEAELSPTEREQLLAADRRLVAQAAAFHTELARFVDLADQRQRHAIPPTRWWWYLDVLSEVPMAELQTPTPEMISVG